MKLNTQQGISYIEVMLAIALLAIALVPALQAVQTGIQSAAVHENLTREHYRILSRLQSVSVESFPVLMEVADTAGSFSTASGFSDPAGQDDRVLVYLSLYDADNQDSDGNAFTVADNNIDGDNNPYTTDPSDEPPSLLWLRVTIENSHSELITLVGRP